jgi:energy-coupling factor transporter ATP-binding protein EcfA2
MLINKLVVPEEISLEYGLSPIMMGRLGRYVAIAGKNGAGKSRLLNLLHKFVEPYTENIVNGAAWRLRFKDITRSAEQFSEKPTPWDSEIVDFEERFKSASYVVGKDATPIKALRFVPRDLKLTDAFSQTSMDVELAYHKAAKADINSFGQSTAGYIQHLQNLWWNTSHPNYDGALEDRIESLEDYENLQDLTQKLLGTRIHRLKNGAAAIFGKSIATAGLSDGQRVILQLIAAIHAKRANLGGTVFILDELENHLHPSVSIEILERLTSAAPTAQIWIATHSIPLLAYIASQDPMALWFMENGEVKHAGRHPEKVLESLLGDDERIGQLNSFTGLPAQLAAVNYAVESLVPPLTIAGGDGDPQVNQISTVLLEKFGEFKPEILDFGAGKGRLLEGIVACRTFGDGQSPVSYWALDNSEKDRVQCVAIMAEYFENASDRHFSSIKKFFERNDEKSLDVIVMCNVLHEIPPGEWHSILSSQTSLFQRALKDDGYLLLVEDQRIPVGEKAHEYGFLVLDTEHLKTLFFIKQADINDKLFITNDFRKDGRLKAHLISKNILCRMTVESRTKAIKELQQSCLDEIKRIRAQPPSYMNGQLHGFWTQQFANAHMYLEQNQ